MFLKFLGLGKKKSNHSHLLSAVLLLLILKQTSYIRQKSLKQAVLQQSSTHTKRFLKVIGYSQPQSNDYLQERGKRQKTFLSLERQERPIYSFASRKKID